MTLAHLNGENAQGVERGQMENRKPPETPIMSDISDDISDKSLHERVHFEVQVLADQLYKAWTWPTHPDGTNMTIREMTPEDREIADTPAMWRSWIRYDNTLRYLEDEK